MALKGYVNLILSLREQAKILSLRDLVLFVINETNYLDILKEDPESYNERKENLDELLSKAAEWEMREEKNHLSEFLADLTLKSNLDFASDSADYLRLMTLHNAKGLEFDIVFLVGLEEDLLPHLNSKNDLSKLEEERRLCYVGLTRAKDTLFLTRARLRFMWGMQRYMNPSPFIQEIPSKYCQKVGW